MLRGSRPATGDACSTVGTLIIPRSPLSWCGSSSTHLSITIRFAFTFWFPCLYTVHNFYVRRYNLFYSHIQNIRQALLTAWKFSFENKIPGALQSSSSAPDGRLVDRFFGNMLPTERLRVCNFTEAAQKVEQVRCCPANLKTWRLISLSIHHVDTNLYSV